MFARLEKINTEVANTILALPKSEHRQLTSKAFADIEIGSAWINQTIRNANARTQVKCFKRLPLETNNQNWRLQSQAGSSCTKNLRSSSPEAAKSR